MYIQWFVKGIAGQRDSDTGSALTWSIAQRMLSEGHGILSNWWRNKPSGSISPPEVEAILTEQNLDLHAHEYATYGAQTPFISVASGCVGRRSVRECISHLFAPTVESIPINARWAAAVTTRSSHRKKY